MAELSPMMRQYVKTKEEYSDAILMFRLGDFYEMFFEDAKTAARELDLVLTGRDCGLEERAPMCGVPFHSADSYIARLVAKGYKVAVCEQMEDPALAKGIVRREVTRILTPGTVLESSMLDEGKNNYLACVIISGESAGVCFADISTSALLLTFLGGKNAAAQAVNELGRFSPSEILFSPEAAKAEEIKAYVKSRPGCMAQILKEEKTDYSQCEAAVSEHFKISSPEDIGIGGREAVCALACTLDYLRSVQKKDVSSLDKVEFYSDALYMKIDISSRRNLELTQSMRSGEKRGTLLWVLDKTKTAMGRRLLREWLELPLVSIPSIIKRQNAVGELVSSPQKLGEIRDLLSKMNDIERICGRIIYETANARELRSLYASLELVPEIKAGLFSFESAALREIFSSLDELEDVRALIDSSIEDEPPFSVREGGMIRAGFNSELDSLRDIVTNGKDYLADIQQREQERTGIKKLKIGYNRVFGYYIEVLNSFKELVPEDYIRKQTLTSCERYITQELKDLESKVLGAQERISKLEFEIFSTVRAKIADECARIKSTAHSAAICDALCSFAKVSADNNYTCPRMTAGSEIIIKDGRHPVVEKMLTDAPFVPNDTDLDGENNRLMIITGPNMAGKSTYMRQTALIVIMAQCGCFVPAVSAQIGITDSVFTRVGASDDLASGQSTFMVEMNEVANILNNATKKSLLIFDEIGRGTSTFDGMSIARAVLEYAADKKKLGAKTLFATHYHELTELEGSVDGVKNYHIAVKKRGDSITFLRKIVAGCASGSYGIEVAKLAGVPAAVVSRAKAVLRELEAQAPVSGGAPGFREPAEEESQLSFSAIKAQELAEKIKLIDVNTLTPIEALQTLWEITAEAREIE